MHSVGGPGWVTDIDQTDVPLHFNSFPSLTSIIKKPRPHNHTLVKVHLKIGLVLSTTLDTWDNID